MVSLLVRHTIADYEKWRPIYDGDETRRRAAGATGHTHVYRDLDNPNVITLVFEWDSAEHAGAFAHDPALAAIMQQAGVVGAPSLVAIMTQA